jgi:hypothetical protein
MLQIVCRTQASVHPAYRHAEIAASIVSEYYLAGEIATTMTAKLLTESRRSAV